MREIGTFFRCNETFCGGLASGRQVEDNILQIPLTEKHPPGLFICFPCVHFRTMAPFYLMVIFHLPTPIGTPPTPVIVVLHLCRFLPAANIRHLGQSMFDLATAAAMLPHLHQDNKLVENSNTVRSQLTKD